MANIYLDHGATTPMHPDVIKKMVESMETIYGNPSSIHQFGRAAHAEIENAREKIAASINAKPHEIIFTSGGTESDNMALIETAVTHQEKGKHIVTTAVEHPAVLRTMEYLETLGFEVTYLPVDEKGMLSLSAFQSALREDTILVSIMCVNNETGVRFPIQKIGELLKEHTAYFHTDAVQAFGLETIDVANWHVDLISATAHKINGPKGIGFLYVKDGSQMKALFHGGEQEEKRRPGTENIAGIVGLAQAVELLTTKEKHNRQNRYEQFTAELLGVLTAHDISYEINGSTEDKSSHVVNLWIKDVPNDLLLMHLDLQGIAVSTGSACTAGNVAPSHVLTAMRGQDHPSLKESIRISYGWNNTAEQIQQVGQTIVQLVQQLKK